MPFLRLLLTALLALVAMGAALFAAVVMLLSALFSGGKVRGKVSVDRRPGTAQANRPGPNMTGAKGEVIDIESTPVVEKKIE